jgi:hypothetical protein
MRRLIQKYPLGYEGYLKEQQIEAVTINAAGFSKNAEIGPTVTEQAVSSPDAAVPVETLVTEVSPSVQ